MLGVMPMQWYVNLVTIAAAGALGWIVLEFLGKPIRAFFDLRDQVRAQLLLLTNVAPLKPRETISTSLEIQQYDVALKAGREAQRILHDLGSQMLAFSENEIAACNGIAPFGFNAVAAGRGLITLSNTYDRNRTDRADFSSKIEKSLRFKTRGGSARREIVEQIAARLKAEYNLKGRRRSPALSRSTLFRTPPNFGHRTWPWSSAIIEAGCVRHTNEHETIGKPKGSGCNHSASHVLA